MENVHIHGVLTNRCTICTCSVNEIGELPKVPLPNCDHLAYKTLYQSADYGALAADGMKTINNLLWHIGNVTPPSLVRPDLLHYIYLGIFSHLMDWLLPFLEDMGRLEAFDNIWKNILPYTSFTHPTKAYRQVTQ